MRILLVEDDMQLARGLHQSLRAEGFTANHVNNAKSAWLTIQTNECDMLILDLGLPDMDGLSLLKKIRQHNLRLPVLILTARDSMEDKIKGLDQGADDYLSKPFDVNELIARLRVIERRLGTATSSVIVINQVSLDLAAHQVTLDKQLLDVPRKEFMVLKVLMEQAGRIQSREQLESKLYEWGEEVASNAIEVHIHHLRKKLPDGFIKTIRGVGYSVAKGQ
ncbi:response regulator [Paraglaciecola hydrolytica]|uniref:XRE family transcriptional regulator n=1 Tax=Paraglaciecola hydrolytica TaxID=1799789 RepID=A0A136A538_9ALTE|nr:response regulator [Paraglaciecola hydrolytica]KXI30337.1 XRE family transcriptional regulator [Paraglaciecola hydrolytica]